MVITMKDDTTRFGVRVGAIIFNQNHTKVLVQKQKYDIYMLPGGRLETLENSGDAIKRELQEELGLECELHLKYIIEAITNVPNGTKYHEIGFYYNTEIDETESGYTDDKEYNSLDEEHDGKSKFKWAKITEIDNYNFLLNILKEKIKNDNNNQLEHIIYEE